MEVTSTYAELYVVSQSYYDFHYNQAQQPTYLQRGLLLSQLNLIPT